MSPPPRSVPRSQSRFRILLHAPAEEHCTIEWGLCFPDYTDCSQGQELCLTHYWTPSMWPRAWHSKSMLNPLETYSSEKFVSCIKKRSGQSSSQKTEAELRPKGKQERRGEEFQAEGAMWAGLWTGSRSAVTGQSLGAFPCRYWGEAGGKKILHYCPEKCPVTSWAIWLQSS